MEDARSPIDDFQPAITGKRRPRTCFVPTACGGSQDKVAAFHVLTGMSVGARGRIERVVHWLPRRGAYCVAWDADRVEGSALDAEALPS